MAKKLQHNDEQQDPETRHTEVDLRESSVYGKDEEQTMVGSADDLAMDAAIDRLESIIGGADEPVIYAGRLGRRVEAFNVSTEEEVDALKVNLVQDDARAISRDGSGWVVDDVAEEHMAEFTEVGPDLEDEGARPVAPGRDDTSAVLRRHAPNTDWGD